MTNIRWIGVILVVTGCGGFGFIHALSYRKAERALQAILTLLEQLTCELHYRMTPLPEALRKAASVSGGQIGRMMRKVAEEMDRQIAPDAACCMDVVLRQERDIPEISRELLRELGKTLGRFDLDGQLQLFGSLSARCSDALRKHAAQRDERIREYQTLGLCAGAALAILLV
jgi:stage III sporulation protein AB